VKVIISLETEQTTIIIVEDMQYDESQKQVRELLLLIMKDSITVVVAEDMNHPHVI
jgi:hypothetical protein